MEILEEMGEEIMNTTTKMTFGQLLAQTVDDIVLSAQRQAIEKTLEIVDQIRHFYHPNDFPISPAEAALQIAEHIKTTVTVEKVLEALKEGE